MAFIQSDLDNLEKAIASGARIVKQGDKEIQYASLTEMLRVREIMRSSLGITNVASGRIYPKFNKGLRHGSDCD